MAWWDRHSDVLEHEIQMLEAAEMRPQKDETCFGYGKAVLHIHLEILGSERDATISYPDLYPYFRPTLNVLGLGHDLRHYNPCSGEVCLLRRGTEHWQPNMTAAQHIQKMLPEWEKVAVRKYEDPRLEGEDNQAEPVTVYYPAISWQFVVMDSSWRLPLDLRSGLIKLALPNGYRSIVPSERFAAWVTEILDQDKKPIDGIRLPENFREWIRRQQYSECLYPWIRLDSIPVGRTQEELTNFLISSSPQVANYVMKSVTACRSGLYGFCCPEESPDGGWHDGWLFLAYHCDHKTQRGKVLPRWIIKSEQAGECDLYSRIPELKPLRSKTVAVVGLGCVGAPSVLALARAGVGELRLLDGDYVSPGTTCRWPLGFTSAGGGKAQELCRFIQDNYPLTRIGTNHYPSGMKDDCRVTIGACEAGYDQWECLEELVKGADLIYDASAELAINQLLCDLATSHNIPYITVSARPGGWGGNVVRVKPSGTSGCYLCYLHALEDGTIPQPSFDPAGNNLQPVGCGDITFKAAGFDVEEISLAGVRMAVSTLCAGLPGGYPPITNDVGILYLRDQETGEPIFPLWHAVPLRKHPKCRACNS